MRWTRKLSFITESLWFLLLIQYPSESWGQEKKYALFCSFYRCVSDFSVFVPHLTNLSLFQSSATVQSLSENPTTPVSVPSSTSNQTPPQPQDKPEVNVSAQMEPISGNEWEDVGEDECPQWDRDRDGATMWTNLTSCLTETSMKGASGANWGVMRAAISLG